MNWICIGLLAGSLVTSLHDSKEACEGRAVTLREAKATAKCVEMSSSTVLPGVWSRCLGSNGVMTCN